MLTGTCIDTAKFFMFKDDIEIKDDKTMVKWFKEALSNNNSIIGDDVRIQAGIKAMTRSLPHMGDLLDDLFPFRGNLFGANERAFLVPSR